MASDSGQANPLPADEAPREPSSDEVPPTRLRRAMSLLLGVVLALAVGEIAVRLMAARTLIYNIEMVRYAKELKMPDPRGEVSHVHRPNASAHLMGVDVSLNALGNRGPDLPPKSADHKRVLVLGSSVTMGWGVPFADIFTSLAESRFNKDLPLGPSTRIELANAGIGNYNTFAQSRLFTHEYPQVKPDLVVLHYFISDAEPRPPGNNSILLRQSFLAAYCYDRFRTLTLAAEGKGNLFKYYSDIYDDGNTFWSETLAEVSAMRDVAAKDGVPLLVMIVPDFHNLGPTSPYGTIYEKIERGFVGRGLHTINMFPIFQRQYGGHESDLWIQRDDPHPNGKGHALMANILYDELSKPGTFTLADAPTTPHS